jgi:hypothetical protein
MLARRPCRADQPHSEITMPIEVKSRRRSLARLEAEFPGSRIIDATSKGAEPWLQLSPFYPHGQIPVPFTPGTFSKSVEGIWQALKVFEKADVDARKLEVSTMKGIKRSVRTSGPVRGHRMGLHGDRLLSYVEARRSIYLPSYRWVLEHNLQALTTRLRDLSQNHLVLLLDYETNGDVDDVSSPLSHAALVKSFVEGQWPS